MGIILICWIFIVLSLMISGRIPVTSWGWKIWRDLLTFTKDLISLDTIEVHARVYIDIHGMGVGKEGWDKKVFLVKKTILLWRGM